MHKSLSPGFPSHEPSLAAPQPRHANAGASPGLDDAFAWHRIRRLSKKG